ncbi:MAG: hypothetical protein V4819_03115 [Verrucomicrobiota bacterium]
MQSRIATLTMMVLLAMATGVFAGGKKEEKTSVTFHLQAEATDNQKMTFTQLANGKLQYFHRLPEISMKDIALFNPFPSTVGDDYGLVFRLKPSASERLAAITAANQGRWMIAQINGRVVDGVTIDKQITDGVIVIWKGVTLADVELLDKELKRAGAEKKKD